MRNGKRLPESFGYELGLYYEDMVVEFFDPNSVAPFDTYEMQKCLEMLYVYGYSI